MHCLLSIFPLECNLHEGSYFNFFCSLLSFKQLEQSPNHSNHSIYIGSEINSCHSFLLLLFYVLFDCFIHISFTMDKNTIKGMALLFFILLKGKLLQSLNNFEMIIRKPQHRISTLITLNLQIQLLVLFTLFTIIILFLPETYI